MVPPQPFGMLLPHVEPHESGVQPHTLDVPPPPQVSGLVHEPQLRLPPQPLEIVPQSLP